MLHIWRIVALSLVSLSTLMLLASSSALPRRRATNAVNGLKDRQLGGHRIYREYRYTTDLKTKRINITGINVIFEDKAGVLWFGNGFGLYTYDPRLDRWDIQYQSRSVPFSRVKAIAQDGRGGIWVCAGIDSEFKYFDDDIWRGASELFPEHQNIALSNMFRGRNGALWFACEQGLVSFDGRLWSERYKLPKAVEQIYAGLKMRYKNKEEEKLAERIVELDRRLERVGKTGEQGQSVSALAESLAGLQDRDGVTWIGAQKGILRFEPTKHNWRVFALPEGLLHANRIHEDRRGRLWFADDDGHLSVYDKKSDSWRSHNLAKYFPQVRPVSIDAIYQDNANRMMFATEAGLIVFAESEKRWSLLTEENSEMLGDDASSIIDDKDGRIWIGTAGGVLVLEP